MIEFTFLASLWQYWVQTWFSYSTFSQRHHLPWHPGPITYIPEERVAARWLQWSIPAGIQLTTSGINESKPSQDWPYCDEGRASRLVQILVEWVKAAAAACANIIFHNFNIYFDFFSWGSSAFCMSSLYSRTKRPDCMLVRSQFSTASRIPE